MTTIIVVAVIAFAVVFMIVTNRPVQFSVGSDVSLTAGDKSGRGDNDDAGSFADSGSGGGGDGGGD